METGRLPAKGAATASGLALSRGAADSESMTGGLTPFEDQLAALFAAPSAPARL